MEVDECEEEYDNCHENADCIDTKEGYNCKCKSGYQGDGIYCDDINECEVENNLCDLKSECRNFPGGFRCDCWIGFESYEKTKCIGMTIKLAVYK